MNTTRRACLQLAGSSLLLGTTATPAAPVSEPEFLTLFAKRQSVRRYKPDPVPDEHLRLILDAARRAPTSGNQQPWKFLVVKDRQRIERLRVRCLELAELRYSGSPSAEERAHRREMIEKGLSGYFSAPVYVVVLTDSKSVYSSYNHYDGPLAAGYLMLAARALGYGTVFVTDSIPEAATKEAFEIPDRYQRVCITPVGVPDGWPEPKPKKALEDLVAWETL